MEIIKELIDKYKNRISGLQKSILKYEKIGKRGMCISLNGAIQAYNAVIKDLQKIDSHGKANSLCTGRD